MKGANPPTLPRLLIFHFLKKLTMHRITLGVTEAQHAALMTRVGEQRIPRSEIIRAAIDTYIAQGFEPRPLYRAYLAHRIITGLSEPQYEALKAQSESLNTSIAALIRSAIEHCL